MKNRKLFCLFFILIFVFSLPAISFSKSLIYVLDSGLNYEKSMNSVKEGNWLNILENTNDVKDVVGHGTSITMLIEQTYPEANIFPIKITSNNVNERAANASVVIDSLKFINKMQENSIIKKNIIINISFSSGPCHPCNAHLAKHLIEAFNSIITQLNDNNILLVVSAGNMGLNIERFLIWPGMFNLDNVICVGSLTIDNNCSKYSNWGKSVDAYTLGEKIALFKGEEIIALSGTSFSTALITAICAEIWDNQPYLTPGEIREKISKMYPKPELTNLIDHIETKLIEEKRTRYFH